MRISEMYRRIGRHRDCSEGTGMRRDFLPGVPGGVGGWNPIVFSKHTEAMTKLPTRKLYVCSNAVPSWAGRTKEKTKHSMSTAVSN